MTLFIFFDEVSFCALIPKSAAINYEEHTRKVFDYSFVVYYFVRKDYSPRDAIEDLEGNLKLLDFKQAATGR